MRAPNIIARNRANATKSTGPRTAEGKAIIEGKARRNGATERAGLARVAAWLAIILDKSDPSSSELLPFSDRAHRALALAKAEARLVVARPALDGSSRSVSAANVTNYWSATLSKLGQSDAKRLRPG